MASQAAVRMAGRGLHQVQASKQLCQVRQMLLWNPHLQMHQCSLQSSSSSIPWTICRAIMQAVQSQRLMSQYARQCQNHIIYQISRLLGVGLQIRRRMQAAHLKRKLHRDSTWAEPCHSKALQQQILHLPFHACEAAQAHSLWSSSRLIPLLTNLASLLLLLPLQWTHLRILRCSSSGSRRSSCLD